MKIALDYDETFTADPKLWLKFINDCQLRGHEIMVVTYRDVGIPVEDEMPIDVYYTAYRSKRDYMSSLGIHIDIWIDDSPEAIVSDSTWNDADRERWRTTHGVKRVQEHTNG